MATTAAAGQPAPDAVMALWEEVVSSPAPVYASQQPLKSLGGAAPAALAAAATPSPSNESKLSSSSRSPVFESFASFEEERERARLARGVLVPPPQPVPPIVGPGGHAAALGAGATASLEVDCATMACFVDALDEAALRAALRGLLDPDAVGAHTAHAAAARVAAALDLISTEDCGRDGHDDEGDQKQPYDGAEDATGQRQQQRRRWSDGRCRSPRPSSSLPPPDSAGSSRTVVGDSPPAPKRNPAAARRGRGGGLGSRAWKARGAGGGRGGEVRELPSYMRPVQHETRERRHERGTYSHGVVRAAPSAAGACTPNPHHNDARPVLSPGTARSLTVVEWSAAGRSVGWSRRR
jgi:hypothetical protein